MVLRTLVTSDLLTHQTRASLTVAAVALSVSLVVAVTSGYRSAEGAAQKFLERFMGSADAQITRRHDLRGGVPMALLTRLRQDRDVSQAVGRLEMDSGLLDRNAKPIKGRPVHVIGVERPRDRAVESLRIVHGNWFDISDGRVAVVDQVIAEELKLAVGDSILLPAAGKPLRLNVVGIIHKPEILAGQVQTIYLPLATLQQFVAPDRPDQVTRILITLNSQADHTAFVERWETELARTDPTLKIRLARENRAEMSRNLRGMQMLSYLGGAVSMVAAAFIVFSSLSMGVSEKQRVLAMLRAIGALRGQLARLVLIEALLLAGTGVLLGVPLGMLWTWALSWMFAKMFTAGVLISWGGVMLGAGGSLAVALLAAIVPAYAAMRVSPLEAMAPLASPRSSRAPLAWAVLGLLLIGVDPLLVFCPWVSREVRFYGHFVLGLPCLLFGFFLLAPLFVCAIERLLGPVIAALFRLRWELLRQQLSGGLWRSAGTAAALMVALAILVVMQTQGHTMLRGWRLPNKFPDIFVVSFKFGGLDALEQQKLATVRGIRPGQVMPIAIASPELGSSIFAVAGAAVMPDATMFFGIDPDKAFEMMELDFRDGNALDARRMLKRGRHVIVTDEFRQLKGLKTGDTLTLKTPLHGPVDYTIAGVVWSPGIDVMVSMFDMGRQFDQRTAASVFGTLDDARNDFGVEGVYLFAANLEAGADKEKLLRHIRWAVGEWGMKAGDVRQIKLAIENGLARLLALASTVAFAALAVASLGVTNTIAASIRTRRWQFGILRSIGVTRGQLLRLVLAEAMLLGTIGCAMGLAAGLEMSLNARQMSLSMLGYNPPLAVPWLSIAAGAAVVALVCLLASLWPAAGVARAQPLALLQAGRWST